MKKQLAILGIIVVAATILYFITGLLQTKSNTSIPCTEEARVCPDGTVVTRTGPHCEFPACPIITQAVTPSPIICGGIRGLTCPGEYYCLYEKKYPDATGVCVKVGSPATPTTPAGYKCPTTSYVDCMPTPDKTKPECAPQYLLWAKDNCPNFQGAAY
jgi:hypothetical protein